MTTLVHARAVDHLDDPGAAGYAYHWPDGCGTPTAGPGVEPGTVAVFQRCRRPGCGEHWPDHATIEAKADGWFTNDRPPADERPVRS